jgi:hypothetical protein
VINVYDVRSWINHHQVVLMLSWLLEQFDSHNSRRRKAIKKAIEGSKGRKIIRLIEIYSPPNELFPLRANVNVNKFTNQ